MTNFQAFKFTIVIIWSCTASVFSVEAQSTVQKGSANSADKTEIIDILNLDVSSTTAIPSTSTQATELTDTLPEERPSPLSLDNVGNSEFTSTLDLGFDFGPNVKGINQIIGRNRNNNKNRLANVQSTNGAFRSNLRDRNNKNKNNVFGLGGVRQGLGLSSTMGFFSQLRNLWMPDPRSIMQRIREVKETFLERERERRLASRRSRNSGGDMMTTFLQKVLKKTVNKFQKDTDMMESMVRFRNERLRTFLTNPMVASMLEDEEEEKVPNPQNLQDLGQRDSLWDLSNAILQQVG